MNSNIKIRLAWVSFTHVGVMSITTLGKNIKYNGDENTVYLIQINYIDFFIRFNLMPTTHFRVLNTRVSKTNQDGDFSGVINGWGLYYFLCFELRCLLIGGCKMLNLHDNLIEVILVLLWSINDKGWGWWINRIITPQCLFFNFC